MCVCVFASMPYYTVCLLLPLQRVHLDISIGEHAVDYAQIASKEKLSELQLRVRQLLDQVEQITKEQEYQRVSIDLWLLQISIPTCTCR